MQPGETLVLVDGSSLAFRSFYALLTSGLRRSDGTPTWAIHGFFNSLFDLLEKYEPQGLAVTFDMAGPTFRHDEFEAYKANRQEMPDDLAKQWPTIKEAVKVLGIPLYELEGYEADDLIGTVAEEGKNRGLKVVVLTGDQDAFQLIEDEGDAVRVLMPGKTGLTMYGRQGVFEKLGVYPEQIIDYKALSGDSSDNIPGVRGIGPKTAVTLLTSYGTLDGVYEHLDEIKSASVRQKLTDGKESAYASKHLATIVRDVPFDFDFEHCYLSCPPIDVVSDYFKGLDFKKLVQRLPVLLKRFSQNASPDPAKSQVATPERVESHAAAAAAGAGAGATAGVGATAAAGAGAAATSSAGGAVAVAEPTVLLKDPPQPKVIARIDELQPTLKEMTKACVFAFDVETSVEDTWQGDVLGYALAASDGVQIGQEGNFNVLLATGDASSAVETAYVAARSGSAEELASSEITSAIKPYFEDATIGKIAYDMKRQANALSLLGINLSGVVFDPMLASYIINPDNKHGLKELSERALGYATVRAVDNQGTGRKQLTINFFSDDKIASALADDARVTLLLSRYFAERLDHDQKYLLYEMEMPLAAVLARMEQNGVALDLPYLAEFSRELTSDLNRLESEIYELAGRAFNINSTQQLQKLLFEELKLTPKGKTKTGFSTDASVLESLRDEHPIIAKILDYRQLTKLRSTYVDALPRQVSKRDGRLHGEFNQATTSTGRLSSSNPNLQNIPIRTELGRRIRRAFIPQEKDSYLISADYSQIELRLLAHMSGDETLIDAFEKDQDIHARTAGVIFDVPIDEVTSDQRRIGKTLNFALVYQQGAFATAQSLGISTKEASSFIEKYFSRYPKVRGFLTKTINEAKENGYVTTLWGRRRYFSHLNDANDVIRKADERAACNAPIQGSAADLMKLAMIRLDRELTARRLKSKLILQVHDELVLEVPSDELDLAKQVVREAMEMGQPLKVPLRVDVGAGKNWMDTK